MHITLSGVHIEITDALRAYTIEKMSSLDKFVKDDTSAKLSVDLSKTTAHHSHGDIFQAEAKIHIRGKEITLKTTQDDLYKSIDILKDMLFRELSSYKDKQNSLFKRSAHKLKELMRRG